MHATTEQLIALRDREPLDATVRQHVATCSRCADEVEVLRQRQQALRDMQLLEPSPQSFKQMQERLAWERQKPNTRGRWWSQRHLALAASLACVMAVLLGVSSLQKTGELDANENNRVANQVSSPTLIETDITIETNLKLDDENLQRLRQRSDALEGLVAKLEEFGRARPQTGTGQAVAALREHITVLDYTLDVTAVEPNPSAELELLWQRRVETLENLVAVQQAELARQGYHGIQMMTASNAQQETW